MGGKGSAPAAPDYTGAAMAQAQASKENLNIQNFANRPTINTPWGTQSWNTEATYDPATGQPVTSWTQNTTLAPSLQQALDSQVAIQQGRSDLAGGFMQRVSDAYSQPFNWGSMPQLTTANRPQTLNSSIADYTPGLQTGVNPNSQNLVGGFNFGGPQMGVSNMNDRLVGGVGQTSLVDSVNPMTGNMAYGTGQTPVNTNFDAMTGGLTRGVTPTNVNTNFDPMTGRLATGTGQTYVQGGLNTADNPALPQFDSGYRDQVANTLLERMAPVQDYQRKQLETQLSNQGFKLGTEGYKRALDELNQRQAAERYNALDTAGNEAQRLFNMGMGARQQAFQEDVTGGQFANQAAGQAFNQGLSANQFQNSAANQAFNQNLQATQAANAAAGQQFNQALGAGQFGNSATQQAYAQAMGANQAANQAYGQLFNQGLQANQFQNAAANQAYNQLLGSANFANQAAGQGFNQNLAGANFANQAVNQAYNQNLGAANFGNNAQQQYYNQLMGQANLANQANQQGFNQNLQSAQFNNSALGQASSLDIARQQAQNQAMAQQYALNQQYAQQMNQARQQAIAEQMQQRGMSLNEMNALLSGQQVSMPQMPSFAASGQAQTPDLMGALNNTYNAQLGAYNAQQAAGSNLMGGLFGMGASALSNPFLFSDRRLKRRIKRVGTHPIGVGLYEYEVFGYPQKGVMAQELQAVRPDLVKRHANGFLMVNYGAM